MHVLIVLIFFKGFMCRQRLFCGRLLQNVSNQYWWWTKWIMLCWNCSWSLRNFTRHFSVLWKTSVIISTYREGETEPVVNIMVKKTLKFCCGWNPILENTSLDMNSRQFRSLPNLKELFFIPLPPPLFHTFSFGDIISDQPTGEQKQLGERREFTKQIML